MRLPGAVGIDFRDRRGMRRGASEILTSLMLVYVANLGMDYVVCGPGAIAGPATHRSSSSAMSRTRLERLIEQGDVPFITQPARASDLDQIAGHAQGIMLRRVPRYARSIGANESRQLYRYRPQMYKGLPIASSTVITPSLPTFFIASARNLPISTSPLVEIVPTWAISAQRTATSGQV